MENSAEIKYPFHERALKKWIVNNLKSTISEDGKIHYTYDYLGSTCKNGGVPFTSILNIKLDKNEKNGIITDAWIDIPEDQMESAEKMCTPVPDIMNMIKNDPVIGKELEFAIVESIQENFAGCLCGRPHINQKWKIILSTIHYAITREDDK